MNQTVYTIIGFTVIFVLNALGSAFVFFFKKDASPKANTLFLGFAAGVMVAASFFSLLLPAFEGAGSWGVWSFIPVAVGFLLGGVFLVLLDKIVPHIHFGTNEEEGLHSSLKKPTKPFFAVMIHNIPEGLAVGFAFGAAATQNIEAAYLAALALSIGISIQIFPEGAAVALPLRGAAGSRAKAFGYGTLSGVVEPVFAVIGYFLAAYL